MNDDRERYIAELENIILYKFIPVYEKYYSIMGLPVPELDLPIITRNKKIPALLRAVL